MKKQLLFLVLSLGSLSLMGVYSYRTLTEDMALTAYQIDDSRVIHNPVQDIPAMSGWTLTSQEGLTTTLKAPESTWTRVAVNHIRTNPNRHLPDNPTQFFLAGVLIDGQHHHVQAPEPSTENIKTENVEANHVRLIHGNLAVN